MLRRSSRVTRFPLRVVRSPLTPGTPLCYHRPNRRPNTPMELAAGKLRAVYVTQRPGQTLGADQSRPERGLSVKGRPTWSQDNAPEAVSRKWTQ